MTVEEIEKAIQQRISEIREKEKTYYLLDYETGELWTLVRVIEFIQGKRKAIK